MTELSPAAEFAWRIAALEAKRGGASAINVDHLVVGILSLEKLLDPSARLNLAQRDAVGNEQRGLLNSLKNSGLDAMQLRRAVRDQIPRGEAAPDSTIHRDLHCRSVFERAGQLASERGNVPCGVQHLLLAMLELRTSALSRLLAGAPTGLQSQEERLRFWVNVATTPTRPAHQLVEEPPALEIPKAFPVPPSVPPAPDPPPEMFEDPSPTPGLLPEFFEDQAPQPSAPPPPPLALLRYGRDLTAEAESGKLGPVIGRRDEMLQVLRVLHRRTKNSPVLIGEAGVGKTAVVEGLAHRIAEGSSLPGRRIVALSLASVVAGTTYRGQFEERLQEILTELRARPEVILFLDELHTIVGAGDSDGRLDAANILKPVLARGEITCIGATTLDEYRRHIESDPALERRFQPILVSEPTPQETREILEGLRTDLEQHHEVTIEEAALDAAIDLTVRYVTTRRLPDKAVDALDEACARARVPGLTSPRGHVMGQPSAQRARVSGETVAAVVSAWTGIPVGRIGQAEAARLSDLEARLQERIIGQAEAIRRVSERVRLARMGLADPSRPSGVFLFLGPSGVGKTELARALAEAVYDGQDRLIRLDMSEYGEKHTVTRLIGAPPGFQGHDEDGQLTGPLRRNPHAVVLLDEAEKAHPEVFDLFLQLFDAGRLTDGTGRAVDGRHATFVLTSNLGGSAPARRALGFGSPPEAAESPARLSREALHAELRGFFRPELLNRIDEVVLFKPLGESDLAQIAWRHVEGLHRRLLDQHDVNLMVSEPAMALMVQQAIAGSGGARDMHRVIARLLEEPLSRELLAGRLTRREHLVAEVDAGRVILVRDSRTM